MKSLQPSSKHCFVCGVQNPFGLHMKFYETAPGEVTAECIVPEQFQGYPGIVHGGIIAAMLDEVAGRTLMSDPPRFMFTARMEIHYRKNVPIGKPLRLVGKMISNKTRTATAVGMIYDQEGTLLAEAKLLLVNIPEAMLASIDIEALGWRVYAETS